MNDVYAVIDLETLSLKPNALITSMGLVILDTEKVMHSSSWAIRPSQREREMGDIDYLTVMWWIRQSEEARMAISANGALSIYTTLRNLEDALLLYNVTHTISHGKDFDLVILNTWYDLLGMDVPGPLNFRNTLDSRTMYHMKPPTISTKPPEGKEHLALPDALATAMACMSSIKQCKD